MSATDAKIFRYEKSTYINFSPSLTASWIWPVSLSIIALSVFGALKARKSFLQRQKQRNKGPLPATTRKLRRRQPSGLSLLHRQADGEIREDDFSRRKHSIGRVSIDFGGSGVKVRFHKERSADVKNIMADRPITSLNKEPHSEMIGVYNIYEQFPEGLSTSNSTAAILEFEEPAHEIVDMAIVGPVSDHSERKATCVEEIFPKNEHKATCVEEIFPNNERKAAWVEETFPNDEHKASCIKETFSDNEHRASCVEEIFPNNDGKAACVAETFLHDERKATCAEEIYPTNERKASCIEEASPNDDPICSPECVAATAEPGDKDVAKKGKDDNTDDVITTSCQSSPTQPVSVTSNSPSEPTDTPEDSEDYSYIPATKCADQSEQPMDYIPLGNEYNCYSKEQAGNLSYEVVDDLPGVTPRVGMAAQKGIGVNHPQKSESSSKPRFHKAKFAAQTNGHPSTGSPAQTRS